MQGLKFAWIDLTRIISSLGLLEINHHFSKLHLEFTRQHHAGLWWWHLPGCLHWGWFCAGISYTQNEKYPKYAAKSTTPAQHTDKNPILSLLVPVFTEDAV